MRLEPFFSFKWTENVGGIQFQGQFATPNGLQATIIVIILFTIYSKAKSSGTDR